MYSGKFVGIHALERCMLMTVILMILIYFLKRENSLSNHSMTAYHLITLPHYLCGRAKGVIHLLDQLGENNYEIFEITGPLFKKINYEYMVEDSNMFQVVS